jgi:hypothetical protein
LGLILSSHIPTLLGVVATYDFLDRFVVEVDDDEQELLVLVQVKLA